MTTPTSPRPAAMTVRFTKAEKALILEAASRLGITPPAYMRKYALAAATSLVQRHVGPQETK